MPVKRRNRTKKTRRTMIVKRTKEMSSGMDKNLKMKFRFVDRVFAQGTAGLSAFRYYSGNSLAFPDPQDSTHQPFGYDQWIGFFDSYTVTGSSIKITAVSHNFDNMMTLRPQIVTTHDSDVTQSMERPNTAYQLIDTQRSKSMRKSTTTLRVLGRPKNQDAETLSASYSQSPQNQWYWMIQHQPFDNSISSYVGYTVEITYHVLLRRRSRMASS